MEVKLNGLTVKAKKIGNSIYLLIPAIVTSALEINDNSIFQLSVQNNQQIKFKKIIE